MNKSLPATPSLEQLRRQAKDLHKRFRANHTDARARVDAHVRARPMRSLKLSDAQLVIAREYGFPSWPKLKTHVETLRRSAEEQALEDFKSAVSAGDSDGLRALFARAPWLRSRINDPIFSFDSPALVHVAGRNDRKLIEALLDLGADLNAMSRWKYGAFGVLHSVNREIGEYLVSRGAKVDVHAAAHLGLVDSLKEVLGANPDLVHARGGDGQTPLHFAASPEVARLLLRAGADLEARDLDHNATAAQWAVVERPDVCRYLIRQGAQPDLFMAVGLGDTALVRRLLKRDPGLLQQRIGQPPFVSPQSEASHIYGYNLSGDGSTPLHTAAQCDQPKMIDLLVRAGLDINLGGAYDDSTPLHLAAWHNRVAAGDRLIALGADLERRSGSNHNNTPLGWAVVSGATDFVRMMLERGAKVEDWYFTDVERGEQGQFRSYAHGATSDYIEIARLLRGVATVPGGRQEAQVSTAVPTQTKSTEETQVKATESFDKVAGMSSASVQKATGKGWAEWVTLLDKEGAAQMKHGDIAKLVFEKYGCTGWWSQMVTVGFEQARGLREPHQKATGFEIGASKTVNVSISKLFKAWTDEKIRAKWLTGKLDIRKTTKDKTIRALCGKQPVNVYFTAKGAGKAQVAVQHGKLKDAKTAGWMKTFWKKRLEVLKEVVEK